MTGNRITRRTLLGAAVAPLILGGGRTAALPQLRRQGTATQLIVDGRPFLMRGGEFSNNVYEAPAHLPLLAAMLDAYRKYDLNTLLVPISWRSLEPQEGTWDFRLIDHLIEECAARDLRVVVLWFGAIKNGGLHYAPRWVIEDKDRFFRALRPNGRETFAISPFCEAAWTSDRRAFVQLMERIRDKDPRHTVIMIQPENETGCQEIDNSRDHSPAADREWNAAVPEDLASYLKIHDGSLVDWLQGVWDRAGKRTLGTWTDVFGDGVDGQKIFMSYYIGRFIERVASAGRAVLPLPMFINDWLGNIRSPGGPIGGPEYHVMDVFRVTTPSAFACVPDIYQENFREWVGAFHQHGNPLLVPEARNDARAAQQCWYTFLQHDGMLFSPYLLVPKEADQAAVPSHLTFTNLNLSYSVIKEMEGVILSRQGRTPRELMAFQLDRADKRETPLEAEFQGYNLKATATRDFPRLTQTAAGETPPFAGLVGMAADDFVLVGRSMRLEFRNPSRRVKSAERGRFRANRWIPGAPLAPETSAEQTTTVQLTEDPAALDLIRIRFKSV